MTKRMLIDAMHEGETRMVIADDDFIEDFDFVTTSKEQLKGHIYLAKITRVEPSLQAAFVEYGGGKQGFLPFSEIHPDYYQIPVEDRKRLIAEEAEETAREEAEEEEALEKRETRHRDGGSRHEGREDGERGERGDRPERGERGDRGDRGGRRGRYGRNRRPRRFNEDGTPNTDAPQDNDASQEEGQNDGSQNPYTSDSVSDAVTDSVRDTSPDDGVIDAPEHDGPDKTDYKAAMSESFETSSEPVDDTEEPAESHGDSEQPRSQEREDTGGEEEDRVEIVAEDEGDETRRRRKGASFKRYRVQEVIKRNQIVLVQVIKEERGNKGVSLTTYISLAGRYCVLMPNSPKGGGVSRKIGNGEQRRKLKEIVAELRDSRGLSAIIRTAGIDRTRTEIKRDYEYLVKLWQQIREDTMASTAPALIYEESDIIKRAIRDLYTNDIEQVLVQGEQAYKDAKTFMKLIMPSHAPRVKQHKESLPIFSAYGIEEQLDSMYEPTAKLPSGGYIVLHPTEALISIDVNSGRSTTERNVEETAIKTNLEAAREIARQLRLRDLAGLIVIDFIDMYYGRNKRNLERALKDALKVDRAKIQMGRISAFGLMELSRQRLRPSIAESSSVQCAHCEGTGTVRSVETVAIQIIRLLEREAVSGEFVELKVSTNSDVVLHLFNHKRDMIRLIEDQYKVRVVIQIDTSMLSGHVRLMKVNAEGKEILHQEDKDRGGKGGKNGRRGRRGGRNRGRDDQAEGGFQRNLSNSEPRDAQAENDGDEDNQDSDVIVIESSDEQPHERNREHSEPRGDRPERGDRDRGERGGRRRRRPVEKLDGDSQGEADSPQEPRTEGEDDDAPRRNPRTRGGRGRGGQRDGRPPRPPRDEAPIATDEASSPSTGFTDADNDNVREPVVTTELRHYGPPPTAEKRPASRPQPAIEETGEVIDEVTGSDSPSRPKRKGWWNKG